MLLPKIPPFFLIYFNVAWDMLLGAAMYAGQKYLHLRAHRRRHARALFASPPTRPGHDRGASNCVVTNPPPASTRAPPLPPAPPLANYSHGRILKAATWLMLLYQAGNYLWFVALKSDVSPAVAWITYQSSSVWVLLFSFLLLPEPVKDPRKNWKWTLKRLGKPEHRAADGSWEWRGKETTVRYFEAEHDGTECLRLETTRQARLLEIVNRSTFELYRALLRCGRSFNDYNVREYVKRRATESFRANAALADVASPGDGAAPRSIASITSGFT